MRSTLLLTILSIALLSFVGWARHERARSAGPPADVIRSEDDSILFVG